MELAAELKKQAVPNAEKWSELLFRYETIRFDPALEKEDINKYSEELLKEAKSLM